MPASSIPTITSLTRGERVPMPARRWKTRVLVPLGIVAAAGGLLAYTGAESLRPTVDVDVIPVVLRPGQTSSVGLDGSGGNAASVVAQAPGWIEPAPYAVNVTALAGGVVREILVLEGDRVEKDQLLARLVDDDARLELVRAEAESRRMMAELVIAEAELKEAKMVWENRTELSRASAVAEAQLAERRAELARLPLEIDEKTSQLDAMRDDLARKEDLVLKRAVAESDVVQLRNRVKAQESAIAATKAMRPVLEARVRAAEAEAGAAKENLRLRITDTRMMAAAHARVEAARAASNTADAMRDEARLRMNRMDIRAPIAGVVMSRLVEPGSKVMLEMDTPDSSWIVRLYDPAKLQVRVDVPLASAGPLTAGMPAEITVEALPGRTFAGVVTRLVHEANIQKNTLQVKVSITSPVPELKPEMLARVKLSAAAGARAAPGPSPGERSGGAPLSPSGAGLLVAPVAVVGTDLTPGASAKVWVVSRARSEAEPRDIRVGNRVQGAPDWIEVLEGLRPGDRLIASDPSRLRPNAKIRVNAELTGDRHGLH